VGEGAGRCADAKYKYGVQYGGVRTETRYSRGNHYFGDDWGCCLVRKRLCLGGGFVGRMECKGGVKLAR
jgi:hypothetical protein